MIKNSIKYLVIGIIAATFVFSLCGCISISVTKGDSADAKVKLNLESSGSKDVLVGSGPSVGHFRHRAGRGDGIDGSHFGERVGNVRRGGVAVH